MVNFLRTYEMEVAVNHPLSPRVSKVWQIHDPFQERDDILCSMHLGVVGPELLFSQSLLKAKLANSCSIMGPLSMPRFLVIPIHVAVLI